MSNGKYLATPEELDELVEVGHLRATYHSAIIYRILAILVKRGDENEALAQELHGPESDRMWEALEKLEALEERRIEPLKQAIQAKVEKARTYVPTATTATPGVRVNRAGQRTRDTHEMI